MQRGLSSSSPSRRRPGRHILLSNSLFSISSLSLSLSTLTNSYLPRRIPRRTKEQGRSHRELPHEVIRHAHASPGLGFYSQSPPRRPGAPPPGSGVLAPSTPSLVLPSSSPLGCRGVKIRRRLGLFASPFVAGLRCCTCLRWC